MKIGTYYYPEQWPREQWERDFDRIAAMGFQMVHMAEFAWFAIEPRPGQFQFDWLDECVDMAADRALDVILCTPTAAPPVWLAQEYPDSLFRDVHGTRARFGGRRHYSPMSGAMRNATQRIVAEMAEHFCEHPSIVGWQIDNEYSGPFDQNPETHAAFRQWLQRRYGTIDELNRAWGCQFWNTYYTGFAQIMFPKDRDPRYANPHQHLDASRFWSWAWADFNQMQARIIKRAIRQRGTGAASADSPNADQSATASPTAPEPFITTNFMPLHLDANPADMAEDLDVFAWDCYPVTGWEKNIVDQTFRLANPNLIGLVHDHMASFNSRWAQLEIQPGQVNWSGVPVLLYPGAVRLWLWTAFAHGAEFLTTYRFRQPNFGIELFHHGLMNPDGVTLSEGGKQFAQVIQEMKLIDASQQQDASATANNEPGESEVVAGLLLDFEQLWYFKTLPQARKWDQAAWLQSWYAALARLGFQIRIIHPDRPWPGGLKMIVAPSVQMLDEELVNRFDQFASDGGNLVLTCRTGLMDRTGQLWRGPVAQPILPLIGASITGYDGLPDDLWGSVQMDGKDYPWQVWGDLLEPSDKTESIASYADQFYRGTIAATRRNHGKGVVSYCGVCAEQSFIDAFVEKIARDASLPITSLPPRVHLFTRDGLNILLNYQDAPVEAPAPENATFLLGSRSVEPAGVAIWKG
jgi:beta-galactosidase